jgi:hypothetical protein
MGLRLAFVSLKATLLTYREHTRPQGCNGFTSPAGRVCRRQAVKLTSALLMGTMGPLTGGVRPMSPGPETNCEYLKAIRLAFLAMAHGFRPRMPNGGLLPRGPNTDMRGFGG